MKIRKLFYIAIFFVSIYFAAEAIAAAESGNICNEGCSLDAGCSGYAPYLCKKSWALDSCVAKGYDSGACGGKTDKGGYCFECSGGCILQSELGGKCGLFTTCGADEYCCKRAEWYASNVCKPKYSDMGCCGGPPSGGDKTTFLKTAITNNKADACTSKIKWEVKAKVSADFADYSADCVEGNPDIKIDSGKSVALTCTSQKLPPATSGPNTARVTWCGQAEEFNYGDLPIDVVAVDGDKTSPYETEATAPIIGINVDIDIVSNPTCRISLEEKNYDDMEKECTGSLVDYGFFCIPPNIGTPSDKEVFISCKNTISGEIYKKSVSFMLVPDKTAPNIDIKISPVYGYEKTIFSINVLFKESNNVDESSIKAYITKDGGKIADINLKLSSIISFADRREYEFKSSWDSIIQEPGKYELNVEGADNFGNLNNTSATFQILKFNNQFKIYTIAVNYDDINTYKTKAQIAMQKFKTVSPFKEPKCADGLNITILEQSCDCSSYDIDTCSKEVIKCVEGIGIYDYDLIMAFSVADICSGYSTVGTYPFSLCNKCSSSDVFSSTCASHEIAHHFKLCDEYDAESYNLENNILKNFRLLAENSPYSGCGNSYPENIGIGKPHVCNTDCSIDKTACELGTCGLKLGGTFPPYDTSIMGGGAAFTYSNYGYYITGAVANPTEYGTEAYNFILNKIKEAGYCG